MVAAMHRFICPLALRFLRWTPQPFGVVASGIEIKLQPQAAFGAAPHRASGRSSCGCGERGSTTWAPARASELCELCANASLPQLPNKHPSQRKVGAEAADVSHQPGHRLWALAGF